jgi:drug/metabolite transporter (DMT)-like permease
MPRTNKNLAWLYFVLLALIWGSSFIIMKRGLLSFTAVQVGAIRIVYAWLFTAFIGFKTFRHFKKADFWPLFVVGWLGNGIPYLLFPLAVSRIDSSIVGIINSLVPLFTLVIGLIWFRFKPRTEQIMGILIGFVGAFFLIKPAGSLNLTADFTYALFAVMATVCYAISINTINSKLSHLNALTITNLSLATVGLPMFVFLLSTDFINRFATMPRVWESMAYLAILGIVGSSLAIIMFNYLIKVSSPIFSSSVTYAIPIVAILWGWFDGEVIGYKHLVGVACILIGIYLVNMRKRSAQSKTKVAAETD